MAYYNRRRGATKYYKSQATRPIENRQLVVKDNGPGEDVSIFAVDISHPWEKERLVRGEIRLFDPTRDDRGPEVPVTLTYGLREGTWFPRTEGIYLLTWVESDKTKRPEAIRSYGLHFGDVSSPQPTKRAIRKLYEEMIAKTPALAGQLKVVKRPCVFCRDSALAPGGSSVDVPFESIPAPDAKTYVAKFYM